MKIAIIIARILLGAMFVMAGAMKLLPINMPAAQLPADAMAWNTIMMTHRYLAVVGFFELVGGLLILVGRFVPLGLTILAPIIINIALFTLLLSHTAYVPLIGIIVLEVFLLIVYRNSFLPLFAADPLRKDL